MQRFARLWWATILLSSVVTGGGSFAAFTFLVGLPLDAAIAASIAFVVAGDVVLAFIMESMSPTRVFVGPGDRRNRHDLPQETGTVLGDFENGSGNVSIRGECWRATQVASCGEQLAAGAPVHVVGRRGLTLVVAAANPS